MNDDKIKIILKETVQRLSEAWGLEPYQTVKKIARFINANESVVITKLLYSCIKESD